MADRPTARRCRICRAPEHGRHKMSCDYARYPSRYPDGPVYVDASAPKGQPIQGAGYAPAQLLGADTDHPTTPRLDVLIERACRHLTPDEGAALRAGWAELGADRERARRWAVHLENENRRLEDGQEALTKATAKLISDVGYARTSLSRDVLGWAGARDDMDLPQTVSYAVAEHRSDLARTERAEQQAAAVRAECEQLQRETRGLNPYAMAGRRDAVARVLAALNAAGPADDRGEPQPQRVELHVQPDPPAVAEAIRDIRRFGPPPAPSR